MVKLDPWLPLDTPDGPAYALFYDCPGEATDATWHCVIRETGQFVVYRSSKVLMPRNITMGIRTTTSSLKEMLGG